MRLRAELKDLGGGDCTGPGEGRLRLDPVGALGGERNGQILDWYNFSSFSLFLC